MTLQDSRAKLRNCLRNLEDAEKALDSKKVEFKKAEISLKESQLAVTTYQEEFTRALDDYVEESKLMQEV